MTREDPLLDLFAQANPVTDPEGLVAELGSQVGLRTHDLRSERMQDLRVLDPKPSRARAPWIVATAAIAVAALAVVALVVQTGPGGDVTAPDTSAPTTTSAPTFIAEEGAAAAVEASIAALNSGDLDSYITSLGGELQSQVISRRPLLESHITAGVTIQILVPCEVFGIGMNDETLVRCEVLIRDDFTGPAGLFEEGLAVYSVLDGKIVDEEAVTVSNDPGDMPFEFWVWFHQAHPAEAEAIGSLAEDVGDLMDSPAAMEVFLQYVDEFVAQSETYPRGG